MRVLTSAFAVLLLTCMILPALQKPRPDSGRTVSARPVDPQFSRRRNQQSEEEIKQMQEHYKNMNKDRHRRLKEDTDKLLTLATELKTYVDKTNEDILSLEVIRKAEEIEKLAKSVREKMKTSYTPPVPDPMR